MNLFRSCSGWTESEGSEIVINHDVMAHIFQQRLIPCAPSCISPNETCRMRWRTMPTCLAFPENDTGLPILSHGLCLHTFCPPRVCAFISWQLGFGTCGRQPGFQHAEPERCPWLRWEQRECSPFHGWAKFVWVTERASSQGFSSQRQGSWIHLVLRGVFSSQIGSAHRNLIQHYWSLFRYLGGNWIRLEMC